MVTNAPPQEFVVRTEKSRWNLPSHFSDHPSMATLKEVGLAIGKSCGLFRLASTSRLRNSRVLVLGYNGVSMEDEHLWSPSLYFSADAFRRRMEVIAANHCTVLSLEEALSRLTAHTLPERSIVLTFDDGTCDFYRMAWPILKEFGYPATLYLTTYYVEHHYPSTPGIWSYLLWKARELKAARCEILGKNLMFNLRDEPGRTEALGQIRSLVNSEKFDGDSRNTLSEKLALTLGLDYAQICDSKVCQLLTPEEVCELAREGVSVQMHMHVHITPPDREGFIGNLETNCRLITDMTGSRPKHFCYPSGCYSWQMVAWLRSRHVESAVTCNPALLSPSTQRLLMPRLLDDPRMSDTEFESWLVGISALVPHSRLPGSQN